MSQGRDRAFKELLLEMGRVRRVDPLLRLIVQRLHERPHVALARIWLRAPGDICAECPMRSECPSQVECLHLVASAGSPRAAADEDWSRIDGSFRRFPLGVRKVGHTAATGEAVEIADIRDGGKWIARPEWVEREGIQGFAVQPLAYEQDVLGVLAVFTRRRLDHDAFEWQRMVADHAAGAIANARAFEEIDRLRARLELENTYLREEVHASFGSIVGRSPALQNVLEQIDMVAPTDATVLITGESGTGKELVAREIHQRSARAGRPMIKVNCASIPRDLYESEFFGHVRGAFTGAVKDRAGRFAAADGGTLFLDEVGEIPLELQSKLLRVLQEKQYERVGEERTRSVDVRIIAATNHNLGSDVEQGAFRSDLYYRLNVFPLNVVPLRKRPEDIPLLAQHFLAEFASDLQRPVPILTKANVALLQRYAWPGNVRELQNAVERALIRSRGRALRFDFEFAEAPTSTQDAQVDSEVLSETEMRRREADNIRRALELADGKISGPGGAAELLGIKPTTLTYRIKTLEIRKR